VRYGQFLFNEASWTLQGEYSCASCHYERGQTTGTIWDLGDEGWGSWKNTKYIRGGDTFLHLGMKDSQVILMKS
jgi:hypothetical protein